MNYARFRKSGLIRISNCKDSVAIAKQFPVTSFESVQCMALYAFLYGD